MDNTNEEINYKKDSEGNFGILKYTEMKKNFFHQRGPMVDLNWQKKSLENLKTDG